MTDRDHGTMESLLDRAGSQIREAATASDEPGSAAPGEDLIADLVRSNAPARRDKKGAPRVAMSLRRLNIGLAAAMLLAILWIATRGNNDADEDPPIKTPLGNEEWTLAVPIGVVEAWGTFSWSGTLPSGGWYELQIHDAETGRTLAHVPELTETSWTPEDTEGWSAIRWQLVVYEADNRVMTSLRGEAQLSGQ